MPTGSNHGFCLSPWAVGSIQGEGYEGEGYEGAPYVSWTAYTPTSVRAARDTI